MCGTSSVSEAQLQCVWPGVGDARHGGTTAPAAHCIYVTFKLGVHPDFRLRGCVHPEEAMCMRWRNARRRRAAGRRSTETNKLNTNAQRTTTQQGAHNRGMWGNKFACSVFYPPPLRYRHVFESACMCVLRRCCCVEWREAGVSPQTSLSIANKLCQHAPAAPATTRATKIT